MRKISMLFSILVVVAMLLTACGGAETTTSVPPVTQDTTSTSEPSTTETGVATSATMDTTTTPGVPVTGGEENPTRVSNQLNFAVVDQNGDQVGTVEDMVLDFDSQKISYVIVGTGGFMDLGEKTLLVPYDMLQLPAAASASASGQANAFVFQGDQEMLKNASSVEITSMLPERGQSAADWDADIRNFWENGGVGGTTGTGTQAVSGTAVPNTTATTTTSGLATSTTTAGGNNGNGNNGSDQGAALQGVMLASEVIGSTITVNQNQGQGQGQGSGQGTGQGAGAATATLAVGATSESTATATTGTGNGTGNTESTVSAMIEDVITDPETGDIQYLVLTATFDDGERWIPVPLKFFKWDADTQTLTLPMNGMALENAPVFQGGEFPDMSTSGWDSEFNDFWNNGGTGSSESGTIPSATPTP